MVGQEVENPRTALRDAPFMAHGGQENRFECSRARLILRLSQGFSIRLRLRISRVDNDAVHGRTRKTSRRTNMKTAPMIFDVMWISIFLVEVVRDPIKRHPQTKQSGTDPWAEREFIRFTKVPGSRQHKPQSGNTETLTREVRTETQNSCWREEALLAISVRNHSISKRQTEKTAAAGCREQDPARRNL